jgi:hypothetical protein
MSLACMVTWVFCCRGASQLIQHEFIKPSSIHVDDILELFGDEYLYLSGVVFVKEVGRLLWHPYFRGGRS